jgi:hypothetical protein
MRPVAVVMSKDVYNSLPAGERENHWLASKVARKRSELPSGEKQQMIPVREAHPYLIVAASLWSQTKTCVSK